MRYTIAPNKIQEMMNLKTEVEIQGMKRAYIRDGVAFVKFLAWLDEKMADGYEISEWEAAYRLTEWRKKQKNYVGLAYENISATGPNAGAYTSSFPLFSATHTVAVAITGAGFFYSAPTLYA